MKPTGYTCKEAVVLDTDGEYARVIVKRGSSCDHCKQAGSCVALSGDGDLEVKQARNLACASEGDRVELRLKSQTLVAGALVMYLVPLLSMALFIAAAYYLMPIMNLEFSSDVLVLVAAVAGLLVSLPLIRLFSARMKSVSGAMPAVTRIVTVRIPNQIPQANDKHQSFLPEQNEGE